MKGIHRVTTGIVVGVLCSSLPARAQVAPTTPVQRPAAPVQGQVTPTPAPSAPGSVPTAQPQQVPPPQQPRVPPPGQPTNETALVTAYSALPRANAEYRLGPGDLIEVGVFGVDEYRHSIRISSSGVVRLPLIDPVTAAGLTAAQLEERIAELLGTGVIKNPQVSVFVKEYRSQPVYVLGAVRTPGQYQITGQMRVVDAISMAGGAQTGADDEVTIQRPRADGGEQTIAVDLSKILETGDLQQNVIVQGGDVINVRSRPIETIYVIGEVNRAGAFTKAPKQPVRVSQLIALAGGPMKTANTSKGILVRYNEAGQRSEVPLDVQAIIKGKSPDIFVQANDVIFIPGSTMKSLGYGVLQVVPGTVAAIPWVF